MSHPDLSGAGRGLAVVWADTRELHVDPSQRRSGIGRWLLEHVADGT